MRLLVLVVFAAWAGCDGRAPGHKLDAPGAAGAVAAPSAAGADPVAAATTAPAAVGAPIVVAPTAAPTATGTTTPPAPGDDEVYTEGPVVPADIDPNKLRPPAPR